MSGKPYHRGSHNTLSRLIRNWWNTHPETTCARCGLTRAQGIELWGKNGEWEAGHIVPGTIARSTLDYQPEHARCNRSAGAAMGNRQREPNSGWLTR